MKITIPKPCHENWETMSPDAKGRFCSACSRTVRDFTIASDEEIIDLFADSSENICGKFHESQLNRNLQYSYLNSMFMKFAAGFILTAGGLVSVNAQQNITNDTLKTEEIKEVVVLGFNKQKNQKMMLGAITVIPAEALVNTKENATAGLSPNLSGLMVSQMPGTNSGGQKIRIGGAHITSGNNQKPLVVMDKKIISLKDLEEVDPNSIKTMNILKASAATALYGEKAKNGVIIITTRKRK
ncbi:TonB-dependent receptor plug domain-containing protein [Chryseobacterium luteum]|uniref:TonB-dependent receptor plug domain-containing protein n=1 Tax=Chryseobacterium luteum TaxID=421531 RepID=A0A085Z0D0_9FLAO|nr:TonB-dependent receptor plug domain-containing protein [Chryseobacterium luteum]KFE97893.1 hypothetical protein IX38_19710 [Chryseobacterium luteum]